MDGQDEQPDPRTGLVEMDEDECWRRLEDEQVGRLAVVVGTHPDIFPVNYRVWKGRIAIRTEGGTKLAGAVLDRFVAFEIDEVDRANHSGWSVVVAGTASEPGTLEEVVELDDLDLELWVATPKSRWLLITPEHVTGRVLPSRAPTGAG
jgi:nitroimidazol reductase NimA-like FMN-containing flavoprotein (pyridoxamine 5'-phosphate oxidase superfamily)